MSCFVFCFKTFSEVLGGMFCSYFINLFIFNRRMIALQYWFDFCHTSAWTSHRYTYVLWSYFMGLPGWADSHPGHLFCPILLPLGGANIYFLIYLLGSIIHPISAGGKCPPLWGSWQASLPHPKGKELGPTATAPLGWCVLLWQVSGLCEYRVKVAIFSAQFKRLIFQIRKLHV